MMQNNYLIILNSDEVLSIHEEKNKKDALISTMEHLYLCQRITNISDFSIIKKCINALDDIEEQIILCNSFIDNDCITGIIKIKETDYLDDDLIYNIDPI